MSDSIIFHRKLLIKFLFFKKSSNYSNANDNENENEEEPKSGKEKRFYSKKINLQP